ncbi:MAG: CPBP family glutamic-type intramembrane protease [Leptolyngbyaceae cyanobacterium bins.59]|nr:CPBP family glutamic-type intramembrane protease [Leptolyngbyaceae cyanobacterium bins.59]
MSDLQPVCNQRVLFLTQNLPVMVFACPMIRRSFFPVRNGRSLLLFWVAFLLVALSLLLPFAHAQSVSPSNYDRTIQIPWNRPEFYPLRQPPRALYHPVGDWVGRLILPNAPSDGKDWVWLEVYTAPDPYKRLEGQQIRLQWRSDPQLQSWVEAVTQDVKFTEATQKVREQGNVVPDRLNGRSQVGPVQSLAGAHALDDVVVAMEADRVTVAQSPQGTSLQVDREPMQVPARLVALVRILGPVPSRQGIPKTCPGRRPCLSEQVRVQHYNPTSRRFDGPQEVVRIPQSIPDRDGIFRSTPRQLEKSPAGTAGWYLYGAQDTSGRFVVRAIKPRSLFQLNPTQQVMGMSDGMQYLDQQNWQDTEKRKGNFQKVWIQPGTRGNAGVPSGPPPTLFPIGTKALVIHLFGGIASQNKQESALGTVTGHFAYGVAQVVRDDFTGEPQWDIQYLQVYAHNPDGIIAGWTDWSLYQGDLQRGWLGNRPTSDVLVTLDAVTQDYKIEGVTLSPLGELLTQLQIMMARYRLGDGTGSAAVNPATSCVQDANQALYIAIQHIRQQVAEQPAIVAWLRSHPNDPQTQRFRQLEQVGRALEAELAPSDTVRPDWQMNAETLAGTRGGVEFSQRKDPLTALLSWRTLLPRMAHDELAKVFLEQGSHLWVLRTNQLGGWDGAIRPLAPTVVFGEYTAPLARLPWLLTVMQRIGASLVSVPGWRGWVWTIAILLGYGVIAIPLGLNSGFLHPDFYPLRSWTALRLLFNLLFFPAISEELVFRVALLPHPTERVSLAIWTLWTLIGLVAFLLYHPLNARFFYPPGRSTFTHPVFLLLAGLLGLACTIAYGLTGSLWTVTLIHWVAVATWILFLGGEHRLNAKKFTTS